MAAVLVAPATMRALTAVVGLVVAGGFGTAVVAAGWHRPSDAIGAFLVCLVWSSVVAAVLVGPAPKRVRPAALGRATTRTGRVVLAATAVAGGVVLAGAASAVAYRHRHAGYLDLHHYYLRRGSPSPSWAS